MYRTKTLILGATVTALALATVRGDACTVIAPNYHFGGEYADSFLTHTIDRAAVKAPETHTFLDALTDIGTLRDDRLHPIFLASACSRLLARTDFPFYFGMTVTKCIQDTDGVYVEAFHNGQKLEFCADHLIDTTDHGSYTRSLAASLYPLSPISDPLPEGVMRGAFENELYLRMPIADGVSYPDAVAALMRTWETELFPALPKVRFACAASAFATHYTAPVRKKEGERILHLVSASMSDIAQSYEEGITCSFAI